MSTVLKIASSLVLVALFHFLPVALPAAVAADVATRADHATDATDATDAEVHALTAAAAKLARLQTEQDRIKEAASNVTRDTRLEDLDHDLLRLAGELAQLKDLLTHQRAQLQAQLDVLGPPPAAGATPEARAVAQQRVDLNARRMQLDTQLKQAAESEKNISNLNDQLGKLRRSWIKDQLALRSDSIANPQFWVPLFDPSADDRRRLQAFQEQVMEMLHRAWQPGERVGTGILLVLALVVWCLGRPLAERGVAWLALTRLPPSRLRRSALAAGTTLATVVTTALAANIVLAAFTRRYELPSDLQEPLSELTRLMMTSALTAGLGRSLLCTRQPSWRLPALADPVARALKPFPAVLAGLLLLAGTLEKLNRTADTSIQVTLLGRGLVSLVVVLTIGATLLRANRVRARLAAAGEPPEARSTLAGLIYAAITATVTASLVALLVGYTSFGRFLTYELVWFYIVLSGAYLLTQLTRDICASLFSAHHASGRAIKQLFGVNDEHLEQASTVISGICTSLLLLVTVLALLTGGFGSTPADLLNSLLRLLGGDKLRSLNILPERIVNALIAVGVGIWLLRSVRRWLEVELLPKLCAEPGMRVSLITLFSNVGYVLLVLMFLSFLGVRWEKLAWIVSALSVGIGFGLQEIVKNFISGLILLTERPIKVGDMVSIAGVEGDIQRINVRATEILLSDRSTVIVPNSQLISQNVRNVTMSQSTLGVAPLQLTFPLDIDPEQVRDLLLEAYRDNETILDTPVPSVTFSQLAPSGITLNVTGFVRSPRIAGAVKSDLLFDILKRLRAAGVSLWVPQALRVENAVTAYR
jgi:small-conductance mechanosensitive channel